jgi:hypothetical protein
MPYNKCNPCCYPIPVKIVKGLDGAQGPMGPQGPQGPTGTTESYFSWLYSNSNQQFTESPLLLTFDVSLNNPSNQIWDVTSSQITYKGPTKFFKIEGCITIVNDAIVPIDVSLQILINGNQYPNLSPFPWETGCLLNSNNLAGSTLTLNISAISQLENPTTIELQSTSDPLSSDNNLIHRSLMVTSI